MKEELCIACGNFYPAHTGSIENDLCADCLKEKDV